jgi:hypothetical protein
LNFKIQLNAQAKSTAKVTAKVIAPTDSIDETVANSYGCIGAKDKARDGRKYGIGGGG